MPRKVIGGLIQAATPFTDPQAPVEQVREAAIAIHEPLIEEAGKRGVQILGLEERGNLLSVASEDKTELITAELDLDMIEEVRRIWQFYRDRRPETYGDMAEMLP